MKFRMLGPLEFGDGTRWYGISAAKWRSLLATLLINSGQVISVDQIVAELWGHEPPATATNLVHGYVARLRGLLDDRSGQLLVTRAPGYLLRAGQDDIDTGWFTARADGGRHAFQAGDARLATEQLNEALALWRGPALADVPVTPLVQAEATRLHEQRLVAIETRMEAELARGRYADVITELRGLTRDHPLREQPWAQLMVALHGSGRRAEALSVYAQVRELLADELGVDPGAALRRAHQIVLAEREPEEPRRVPHQVPTDLPVLIGRDEQLESGRQWLAGAAPWIAVTGPGGVGKTAFATCLAHASRHLFPDGILLARIGSVPTAESVLDRFLGAFDLPVATDPPKDPRERARTFWDLLAGRRVLIVLDDVRDETESRSLFPVAPGCGLLVTSRRRLTGLESLRAMPLDVLSVDAGVRLLRTSAGDMRDDQHATASAIVQLCGGLPSAIKIAGARLAGRPNWTVADLACRLADARSRLDWLQLGDLSVRATLVESVSSLTDDQRRLLRRLSQLEVPEFAGWVTSALLDQDAGQAERLLDDLVEAHLVEPAGYGLTGPRYKLHDLIRLVAGELAHDSDVTAIGRVLHGWLALAAAADDRLAHWIGLDPEPAPAWWPARDTLTAAQADAMRWFDEEHDALAHAVNQAAESGHADVSWALAQRMSTYLELRGRYAEWRDVLVHGLRGADDIGDRQGQATMLGLLMQVAAIRGEHRSSLRYAVQTVAAYRELDASPMAVFAGAATSTVALDAARRRGDALAVGLEASRLALALRLAGEPADYLSLFEEAQDAFRAGGAPLPELWATKNVGLVYCRQRRFAEADRCQRRARTIMRDLGDRSTVGYADGDLAGVAAG